MIEAQHLTERPTFASAPQRGTLIAAKAAVFGAIAVLVGLFLVIPLLAPLLPTAVRDTVGKFLPYIAGQAIFNTATNNNATLSPGAGLAVFALYATLALAIAIVLIRHREA
jgi:ABC-2 type transport system permease protein